MLQGGLEVPCILTFSTPNARDIEKTNKLVESSLSASVSASIQATTGISATSVPDITIASSSSGKGCSLGCSTDMASCSSPLDLTGVTESDNECKEVQPSRKRQKLNNSEIQNIIMGVELSDLHINMAQRILKHQFPALNGLESTLFQDKEQSLKEHDVVDKLQIIHCKERHHWIVASTVKGRAEEVVIMDSKYRSVDEETKQAIHNLFQYCEKQPRIKVIATQKQKGNKDCGLFAIAMATAIAFGNNPSRQNFCQELMRAHLVDCLKKDEFMIFP